MATAFHAVVVASLVFAFDFSSRTYPVVPLKMQATLVTEEDIRRPPPVEVPEPVPEPEPEAETDTSEQDRQQAEEEKRRLDMQAEQDRIRLQQEQDREKREKDEADRRQRREAEVERRRELAESKRLEDLERQRAENERLRREAEEADIQRQQQALIDAESERIEALEASDFERWVSAIGRRIGRYIVFPASTPEALECDVNLRLLPSGEVVKTDIGRCNVDVDSAVIRAIETGVARSSPFPLPENRDVFKRDLKILLKPTQ
jgi:colicin import membrane protein